MWLGFGPPGARRLEELGIGRGAETAPVTELN
uniref:Uncharacterized protein n=1 Tax=Arundo donax TaxID=35708 RepID=A0A0A9EML7_ARUDO